MFDRDELVQSSWERLSAILDIPIVRQEAFFNSANKMTDEALTAVHNELRAYSAFVNIMEDKLVGKLKAYENRELTPADVQEAAALWKSWSNAMESLTTGRSKIGAMLQDTGQDFADAAKDAFNTGSFCGMRG